MFWRWVRAGAVLGEESLSSSGGWRGLEIWLTARETSFDYCNTAMLTCLSRERRLRHRRRKWKEDSGICINVCVMANGSSCLENQWRRRRGVAGGSVWRRRRISRNACWRRSEKALRHEKPAAAALATAKKKRETVKTSCLREESWLCTEAINEDLEEEESRLKVSVCWRRKYLWREGSILSERREMKKSLACYAAIFWLWERNWWERS